MYDVVVVDDGGGEEDEFEVELVDFGVGWFVFFIGFVLLFF